MKNRFIWASALALAALVSSQKETKAAYTNADGVVITNGVIIITTRSANDDWFFRQSSAPQWDADEAAGPGNAPGDAAMAALLQDNGYSTRILPEKALSYLQNGFATATLDYLGNPNNPENYYHGGSGPSLSASNVFLTPMLVISSGSGSSTDMSPLNTNKIPIITGENSLLGDSTASIPNSHAEMFLYTNRKTSNPGVTAGLYMRVLNPNHPIMQGIPLDATNRVKIWRDPYPEENAHVLTPGGNPNYQVSWTANNIADGQSVPAPGLTVLGTLDYPNTNMAVFAVMEAGGTLADTTQDLDSQWLNYTTAPSRLAHFFVNEQGGTGQARRCFNCLTVWGRIIFVRTCKWAMSETLTPYQGLGIIDVGQIGGSQLKLSWTPLSNKNYRIEGTTDFVNWLPIADSITNGADPLKVSRTLNIASGPQAAFLRVAALP